MSEASGYVGSKTNDRNQSVPDIPINRCNLSVICIYLQICRASITLQIAGNAESAATAYDSAFG